MKLVIISALALLSLNLFAADNLCARHISRVIKNYEAAGKSIASYRIKDCSSLTAGMGPVFDENQNSNAPDVKRTNACAAILTIAKSTIPELLVIDDVNDIAIYRNFENRQNENIDSSLFGDQKTGSVLFIRMEGQGRDNVGSLKKISHISRATYDLNADQLRIVRWKLGLISNTYSHDYTVQCGDVR